MKEATFERAAEIAKKAGAITNSIEKLAFVPDKITLTLIEGEGDSKQHEVQIFVEDSVGTPVTLYVRSTDYYGMT